MRIGLILTALAATAATATAAPATPPASQVYRLTPEQIAGIAANPAPDAPLAYDPLFDRSLFDDAAPGEGGTPRRDRKPHGEVGAFVGSGGARGVFGSTIVPLGDNGAAAFSFESSRDDHGYRRRR